MWGSVMMSNYAKQAAGGLGTMMTSAIGKRTLMGGAVGMGVGGYTGGVSGAMMGGLAGAAGGRYGGVAMAHRGAGMRGAMGMAGRLARNDFRGASMMANRGYNKVASSLKNWGT